MGTSGGNRDFRVEPYRLAAFGANVLDGVGGGDWLGTTRTTRACSLRSGSLMRSNGGRSRLLRRVLALTCVLLGIAEIVVYERSLRLARAAQAVQSQFSLAERWPLDTRTMRLQPAGDLVCDALAEMVLKDVQTPFPADEPDVSKRQRWLDAASQR